MQKKDKIKVVLTGGHMSPLISMLDVLQDSTMCIVIGRKHAFEKDNAISLEYKLIHEKNIPFYNLNAARLQRKFTNKTIPSLIKFPGSFYKAYNFLKKERPDVVLTFGGYIAFPVALACASLNIPVVLHEQTQKAGLTNKLISKFAQKICVSFPTSLAYFPKGKTVVTGNPVRKEVLNVQEKMDIKISGKLLLIMGGSGGSHIINNLVEGMLPELLEKFTVIHQVGDTKEFNDYEKLIEKKATLSSELSDKYVVVKHISPTCIGWAYKQSDVILSRAGANTVSELLILGKKAVLIPLPHAGNNEQLANAKLYKSSGLGEYVEQKDATPELLLSTLASVESNQVTKIRLDWYNENAAEKIAEVVFQVAATHHEEKSIPL